MVASIRQSSEAISPTIWEWSRKVGDSTSNARSASAPRNHIELSRRVFLRLEYHCFVGRISWFEAKTASIRNAVRAYLAHPIYAFYAFEFCLYISTACRLVFDHVHGCVFCNGVAKQILDDNAQ